MANITIEYMILIPLLILQIFLLPFAANIIMGAWTNSSETISLQDAATHLTSSIQQFYLFINNPSLTSANITNQLGVPTYINSETYVGKATLIPGSGSQQVLNLTLSLSKSKITVSSIVTLGENVRWDSSFTTFISNSTTACISAQKYTDGTIVLSFRT
jgi:archaellum component FlaG (FlaF/FlaG flagellin family)